MSERVSVPIEMVQSWRYSSGDSMERFSNGIRHKRIEAVKCGNCQRRYLPPRPVCGNCHLSLTEWVPVSDVGTLEAWTVVYLPFLDGRTGELRDGPYGMGLIRLDGSDTTLNHFLNQNDPAKLAVGMRVRIVWRDELHGAMDDILHFEEVS
ncbi:MAG: Zn-ribbon domain-containing OB-fold protein [Rhodobacteraceae bacterium]|nr:Zn-ribbon domain-containing OB-fold protein [Paracoccaceae bacterium]